MDLPLTGETCPRRRHFSAKPLLRPDLATFRNYLFY